MLRSMLKESGGDGLGLPLEEYKCVALDTAVFIYFFEENEEYFPLVKDIFSKIDEGALRGVTSMLTLLEVLVKPIKEERDDLVDLYSQKFLVGDSLTVYPLDSAVAKKAAEVRASSNLRTPDAIQIATAITGGAEVLITNDQGLSTADELEVIVLKDYL